jgi:2-haloacid dehalogenase
VAKASQRGILFDAYGTLFDVYSVGSLAEQIYPGQGAALAALWREKQVDYTRLRTLSDRYVDFLKLTEDALRHACARLRLALSAAQCERLLGQYHRLTAFPEVLPTLTQLRSQGFALAILSNGTPRMLESAVDAAGLSGLFTHILSADQVRKYKTAPEVYALGLAAFDLSRSRTRVRLLERLGCLRRDLVWLPDVLGQPRRRSYRAARRRADRGGP